MQSSHPLSLRRTVLLVALSDLSLLVKTAARPPSGSEATTPSMPLTGPLISECLTTLRRREGGRREEEDAREKHREGQKQKARSRRWHVAKLITAFSRAMQSTGRSKSCDVPAPRPPRDESREMAKRPVRVVHNQRAILGHVDVREARVVGVVWPARASRAGDIEEEVPVNPADLGIDAQVRGTASGVSCLTSRMLKVPRHLAEAGVQRLTLAAAMKKTPCVGGTVPGQNRTSEGRDAAANACGDG